MCGITGSYQQADGQKLVDIMTDRIAHRGPDAGGIWSHEGDRVASISVTGGFRSSICPPPPTSR